MQNKKKPIRLFKPSFGNEEIVAIKKVFKKSWIGYGPEVKKFEKLWSNPHRTCFIRRSGYNAFNGSIFFSPPTHNEGDSVHILSELLYLCVKTGKVEMQI